MKTIQLLTAVLALITAVFSLMKTTANDKQITQQAIQIKIQSDSIAAISTRINIAGNNNKTVTTGPVEAKRDVNIGNDSGK